MGIWNFRTCRDGLQEERQYNNYFTNLNPRVEKQLYGGGGSDQD